MELLLGHLAGDYLFQNNWMAENKSERSIRGILICALHCIIYTFCVVLFTGCTSLIFIGIVFLNHFLIDHYSLANKWLKWLGNKTFWDLYELSENSGIPRSEMMVRMPFTIFVYIAVDNGWHLIINYLALMLLS